MLQVESELHPAVGAVESPLGWEVLRQELGWAESTRSGCSRLCGAFLPSHDAVLSRRCVSWLTLQDDGRL